MPQQEDKLRNGSVCVADASQCENTSPSFCRRDEHIISGEQASEGKSMRGRKTEKKGHYKTRLDGEIKYKTFENERAVIRDTSTGKTESKRH